MSPDDDEWLAELLWRSPLLPEDLRQHWMTLIPWLATADRYALAAILVRIEHACAA